MEGGTRVGVVHGVSCTNPIAILRHFVGDRNDAEPRSCISIDCLDAATNSPCSSIVGSIDAAFLCALTMRSSCSTLDDMWACACFFA